MKALIKIPTFSSSRAVSFSKVCLILATVFAFCEQDAPARQWDWQNNTLKPASSTPPADSSVVAPGSADLTKALPFPLTMGLSRDELLKKNAPMLKVKVEDQGSTTEFEGIPLRYFLQIAIPDIENMKQWKLLAREKIVVEVTAPDEFAALFASTEIATNESGDRFILALNQDGKPLQELRLICPNDEHHVRWVHNVTKIKFMRVKE